MSCSDPIADMLTMIKNASAVNKESLEVRFSGIKQDIAKILKDEGYIKKYEVVSGENNKKFIKIVLKYDDNGNRPFEEIKRISKPGSRVYTHKKDIHKVRNGFGISILSTNKGVITGKQARVAKVGGEIIAYVW